MNRSSPWIGKLKKLDYYTKTSSDVKKRFFLTPVFVLVVLNFLSRSSLGGFFAVLVFTVMLILFISELSEFLSPRTKDYLSVDVVRMETIDIDFDITFHRIPCEDVTVDLLDESGAHFSAVGHNVIKKSLDKNGNELRTLSQDKLSEAGNSEVSEHALLHQPGYCHDCLKEIPEEAHELFTQLKKKRSIPMCCNSCPALVILYQMLKLPTAKALQKSPCSHRNVAKRDIANGEVGCRAAGTLKVNKIGGNFHIAAGKSGTQR